jgi:hypothetical protein
MTIRPRRLALSLAAAVLVTAALVTTVAAAKSPQAGTSPRMLPAYAHGSITGAGPHGGVRLVLVAWPKARKVPVGHKVHLKIVGRAISSSSGSYAIHPSVVLPKGLHNLEVLARSGAAVGAFGFPRKVARGGRVLLGVDGSASTGPVRANIHMMALPKAEQLTARHPSIPYCLPYAIKVRELGQKWVDIGGLYSIGMPGAEMKMTYAEGSTTTISLGVTVPFTNGSFSAGGSFTATKTGVEGFTPQFGVEENMQTPYTFGEYKVCLMDQVQSEVWATGQHAVTVLPPGATHCGGFIPNHGSFSTSNEKAGTFTAGVELKKEIGINLSAQSGYNKDTAIKWIFGPGGGYLCGTDNLPSKAAWNVMDVSPSGNPPPVSDNSRVKGHRASR